ncbi:hypothetical protein [Candidatus Nitronereus thalassa]|uniref:Uncharacterized protein n=1 Tax=Candidatus Nitronereus thalassa TaxID=3020898 RepID=A0ABU3K542_9BACT|nr:hypothetical protein [Candidatus Nitronereus thalassa]MDT7041506.1 hypothetical protein [Candidatus Nitronereus thalassa]
METEDTNSKHLSMKKWREIRFTIDAYTPDTIPMARLVEYMGDLANMLGEEPYVHFDRLESGSIQLIQRVDYEAFPKVQERMRKVGTLEGPQDAMKAYERINNRLRDDNGIGAVLEEGGAKIIQFPGRDTPQKEKFGPFREEGFLDGIVIRIGGKRELVPVHLQSGDIIYEHCEATRNVARELGHYMFGQELRVKGTGKWSRNEDGEWLLETFKIDSFEELDSQPLSAVVAQLRNVKGSQWDKISNPWEEIERLRNDNEEP